VQTGLGGRRELLQPSPLAGYRRRHHRALSPGTRSRPPGQIRNVNPIRSRRTVAAGAAAARVRGGTELVGGGDAYRKIRRPRRRAVKP
jgi:hypothetical protein